MQYAISEPLVITVLHERLSSPKVIQMLPLLLLMFPDMSSNLNSQFPSTIANDSKATLPLVVKYALALASFKNADINIFSTIFVDDHLLLILCIKFYSGGFNSNEKNYFRLLLRINFDKSRLFLLHS